MKNNEEIKFPGFPKDLNGRYWTYPKIMDSFWCQLTGSEQKVLDFILRRTFGWRKTEDRISISQFKNGIKTRDGRWIERGTGLKKDATIIKAYNRIAELGFIDIVRKSRKVLIYRLRFLTEKENITNQNGEIATNQNGDTTTTRSTPLKTTGINLRGKKPYYRGMRLYKTGNGRWKAIPNDGGEHLDFVGHEWEIEWK